MSQIPLSVIVVTKNPGAVLDRCLAALTRYGQILVVDSHSTDHTKEICAAHYKEYIPYEWNGTYPKKRQWCLDNLDLEYDWVFFVDADELVPPELSEEIHRLLQNNPAQAGYFISGQYVWNDTLLSYGLRNRKIALFNRNKMHFPEIGDLDCPGMGEIEGHYQPVLTNGGSIGSLATSLLHHANHSPRDWRERHQRYAAWERCMNKKKLWPRDPMLLRQLAKVCWRKNPLRPELAFLHSYLFKLGFLDGLAGFDFARSRWTYYNLIRSGHGITSIE